VVVAQAAAAEMANANSMQIHMRFFCGGGHFGNSPFCTSVNVCPFAWLPFGHYCGTTSSEKCHQTGGNGKGQVQKCRINYGQEIGVRLGANHSANTKFGGSFPLRRLQLSVRLSTPVYVFNCLKCLFSFHPCRARTLTALEQHRMQKHDGHLAAGGVGPISPDAIEGNGVVPHFPALPSLGPSALNGIFSGLFPAFASLPSSPISPVTGGGGGGLFPSIPSFMDQHQQQHQQQNAQQLLLAQLFAAHKLASAFLSSSSPEAQQPQPQPSSTAPNGNETKLF
jgi:hypothetical protein